jgi:hypothetical protein
MRNITKISLISVASCFLLVPLAQAQLQHSISPVEPLEDRDVYYPGTEALAPDEMRVTACGTGMPNARPKQAAACWLVELGNGDKFLFDIGTGSAERISALKIPYNFIDKVFIGHLHSDHFGDLDALWVGGVVGNRVVPLRVWGPSSIEPKYGTKKALEAMEEMLAWDVDTRMGNTDTRGLFMNVTEFDLRRPGQLYPRVERSQVRLLERYLPEQVVDGAHEGRRHRDSRVLRLTGIPRRETMLHAPGGVERRHSDSHFARTVRQQSDGCDRAAPGSRLSLLQRFRHGTAGVARHQARL